MAEQLVFDFEEIWKPVPGHPGYEISNLGRARSLDRIIHSKGDSKRGPYTRAWRGKVLNPSPDAAGYRHSYPFGRIHCAVMLAFVGPCPDGLEVRHLDGKKNDNRLVNLCYGTRSENIADAVRHGTNNIGIHGTRHGAANHATKLSAQAVMEIRRDTETRIIDLAKRYGVHRSTITKIRAGLHWRHLK